MCHSCRWNLISLSRRMFSKLIYKFMRSYFLGGCFLWTCSNETCSFARLHCWLWYVANVTTSETTHQTRHKMAVQCQTLPWLSLHITPQRLAGEQKLYMAFKGKTKGPSVSVCHWQVTPLKLPLLISVLKLLHFVNVFKVHFFSVKSTHLSTLSFQ